MKYDMTIDIFQKKYLFNGLFAWKTNTMSNVIPMLTFDNIKNGYQPRILVDNSRKKPKL